MNQQIYNVDSAARKVDLSIETMKDGSQIVEEKSSSDIKSNSKGHIRSNTNLAENPFDLKTLTIESTYNGRKIRDLLYNTTTESIDIGVMSFEGQNLKPEKKKRNIHIWFPHFIKFHNHLVDTLEMFNEWNSPLVTKFIVKGGYELPKCVMQTLGIQLDSLARWFWMLNNGWTMCALFTKCEDNKGETYVETETHYTGECLMEVELYFIETVLVLDYIDC